jgi:hypothetical protein
MPPFWRNASHTFLFESFVELIEQVDTRPVAYSYNFRGYRRILSCIARTNLRNQALAIHICRDNVK